MQNIVEFHQGWMIELKHVDGQYQFLCSSPTGEILSDNAYYDSQLKAFCAAFQLIDQFFACYAIRNTLREAYEGDRLPYDEWAHLTRSLDYISRVRFSQSPS